MRILLIYFLLSNLAGFSQGENWKSYPDSTLWNFYSEPEISVESLMSKANGKRLLLFYFEVSNNHINKLNQFVLYDPEVVNFIRENFYPLAVGLDTNPQSEKVYRKFLEDQTYYIKTTPAFSIYNVEGILRGSKPFTNASIKTKEEFLTFLKKRLN